jgi:DNA-binding CsgD family transcriptional regulator
MATGFFLIAIYPQSLVVGGALSHLGYCYLYLIMCCLCSYLARVHKLSSHWVIGLGTGCLLLGQFVGQSMGAQFSGADAVAFATTMAFVILLAGLIMTGSNIAFSWGTMKPGTDELLSSSVHRACNEVAAEAHLSKRELDVLVLLVRGRTRRYVSEQLNVSEETVKSHTGNIYIKLGVHSHSELVNLIENHAMTKVGR